MVRVATILKKFRAGIDEVSIDGLTTEQQLATIRSRALAQIDEQTACWSRDAASAARGRRHPLPRAGRLHAGDRRLAGAVFQGPDLPGPHAAGLRPRAPVPVHLEPQHEPGGAGAARRPHQVRAREGAGHAAALRRAAATTCRRTAGAAFVFLEDVIRRNIQELFPGTQVEGAHLFRIIRDTDMVIQEDEADDLLETVDRGLKQLRYGALSLLQVEADMPRRVLNILMENFEVEDDVVVRTSDRLGFGDWHAAHQAAPSRAEGPAVHRPARCGAATMPRTVFEQIARPGLPAPPPVRVVHVGRDVPARRHRRSATSSRSR